LISLQVGRDTSNVEYIRLQVVLTVIENQALVWLGTALAPFLPLLGAAANALHFGVQKLLALHCFAPPKKPYSASRTSTIAHGLMLGADVTSNK
jgi:TMC domain